VLEQMATLRLDLCGEMKWATGGAAGAFSSSAALLCFAFMLFLCSTTRSATTNVWQKGTLKTDFHWAMYTQTSSVCATLTPSNRPVISAKEYNQKHIVEGSLLLQRTRYSLARWRGAWRG
jgi:hypothetical protein